MYCTCTTKLQIACRYFGVQVQVQVQIGINTSIVLSCTSTGTSEKQYCTCTSACTCTCTGTLEYLYLYYPATSNLCRSFQINSTNARTSTGTLRSTLKTVQVQVLTKGTEIRRGTNTVTVARTSTVLVHGHYL